MDQTRELFDARCHWIGGEWRRPRATETLEVRDPSTEEVFGAVACGSSQDIDDAVSAALSALPAWGQSSMDERLRLLERLCQVVEDQSDDFASLITREVGAPVSISGAAHVGLAVEILRSFIEIGKQFPLEERVGQSLLLHEPVGAVGCITPWNLPLILIAQKLGAALVAGCTVVLKPSELTPFNALWLAESLEEAGYLPGVFNVVTGDGRKTGEALVKSAGISKISFTGSTRAGRRVSELAAGTVKRVGLELGGKSANVILDELVLEQAVRTGIHQACFNSGQSCIAWSRILVPRSCMPEAAEIARDALSNMQVGDPQDPSTVIGPLVSEAAMSRVESYIRSGMSEGAELVLGGPGRPEGLDRGYFVRPTVFSSVTAEMTVAREEIFGPVVCILAYDDEDEAVAIANATDYGLHGSVWSNDEERAMAVARQIRTGMVNINGYGFDPLAPFGGCKQSGVGKELGEEGLREFLETKTVQTFDI
ncbi:MAG: aldehyde dehydrogenase family protein [Acidimicrobiales bacterium]